MGVEAAASGSSPAHASFGVLLRWHLRRGTRPSGSADRPGIIWGNEEFAGKVGPSSRTLNNWLNDKNLPDDLISIERVLFGEKLETYSEAYASWCAELRVAYDRTRLKLKGQEPPLPTGGVVIDTTTAANLAELLEIARKGGAFQRAQEEGISELAVRNIIARLGGEGVSRNDLVPWMDNWIEAARQELGRRTNEGEAFEAARREAKRRFKAGQLKDASAAFVEELRREETREPERLEERKRQRLRLLEEAIRFDELALDTAGAVEKLRWMATIYGIYPEGIGGWLDERGREFFERGDKRGQNAALLIALAAFRASQEEYTGREEYTREREPLHWAAMQYTLANALRALGERQSGTKRLEEAVAAYRAALEERTRERVPFTWAAMQHTLANALRALGERESGTERLEEAVAAYRAALEEPTRREFSPRGWAMTQNNLGNALQTLSERETGTERLEEAVVAYRAALAERTRERVPLDGATTQNNLGNALQTLSERETGTERLEEAVVAYQAALVPLDWATTQNNLANALRALGRRES